MFDLKNIILLSKNGKQYKSRVLLRSWCRCCSGIPCPGSYASHSPSNSAPLLLLMMEGKSRANVATLRRYCLLTIVLVDPKSRRWDVTTWGRHDVGTSRRGDVTTWGRHDVGTSRRWNVATLQPPSYFAFHCSKLPPKFALFNSFAPAFTELAILRYRVVKIHN